MKLSHNFTKTTKQLPADETSKNAQLLIRAGYVNKTMSGVYAYLPLGLKVITKIETIVRKHMNSIGSQEVLMNSLHPKSWWEITDRWDPEKVDVLFRLQSQTQSEYALACSHEEQVTPIAKMYINSWKDLPEYTGAGSQYPLSIYQVQTKFRDELRSKSGMLRGREFRMKDMYDFHRTQASADTYYELVKETYHKVYQELGLKAYAIHASGGMFTKNDSHEFSVICDAGEDKICIVKSSGEAYNQEVAPAKAKAFSNTQEEMKERQDVEAHDIIGVDALAKHFTIPVELTTKTMFYENERGEFIVAAVRGKYKVSEEKLKKVTDSSVLRLASEELVMKMTGAKIGYAGLLNLPAEAKVYLDESCANRRNFECGTNKTGYHSINVNFGRDISEPAQWYDLKEAESGDLHPETGEEYVFETAAEVGNIFKLGDKYTKAFDLTYTDENNVSQTPIMNCHGIGTSRCMGIIAEIYSDEQGLKWPESVAPFKYHLVTFVSDKDEQGTKDQVLTTAKNLYHQSRVKDNLLWDDRADLRMGEKLADAELIGCPFIAILTARSLENGGIELKTRATGEAKIVSLAEFEKMLAE
jgi:prolyl-tRNA synthetase